MENITRLNPTIAELLAEFFQLYKPAAPRVQRERIDRVRGHLGAHLEQNGPRELTTPQLLILEADKAFDPHGAFARTMHAPELYYTLVSYLGPDCAMSEEAQRQTQVDVVAALATFLWSRRLVSQWSVSECALIEFDIAMERARNVKRPRKG